MSQPYFHTQVYSCARSQSDQSRYIQIHTWLRGVGGIEQKKSRRSGPGINNAFFGFCQASEPIKRLLYRIWPISRFITNRMSTGAYYHR